MRKPLLYAAVIFGSIILAWVSWPKYRPHEDRTPPVAYLSLADRFISATSFQLPGRPFPCAQALNKQLDDGTAVYLSKPVGECVKLLPEQQLDGVVVNWSGTPLFCASPASHCHWAEPMTFMENAPSLETGKPYLITFIGQRTQHGPGRRGPFEHAVVVRRVLSIDLITER